MRQARMGELNRQLGLLNGGFRFVYYDGKENHCPGCGGRNWVIGRLMAECAHCETALPLQAAHGYGFTPRFHASRAPGVDEGREPDWPVIH